MNYAALLAVMVLLAFFFPVALRLGEYLGLGAGTTAVALWSALVFALALTFVRWRVSRERISAGQLEQGRRQILERPTDPAAYHVGGQHLALLLLERGRRREAAELIDRYARLGGARDAEILALQEALSSADRWRFKREAPDRLPVRELQAAQKEHAQKEQARQVSQQLGEDHQSQLREREPKEREQSHAHHAAGGKA
ncbi:hypothetical protein [Deinococcus piscis]|uniref:hypothetical protein n=1 Tax=Deinococcus piscis TaxID=394230 RepID=UPI001671E86C|nr:hypothetical protein [Deinococcus piscis]